MFRMMSIFTILLSSAALAAPAASPSGVEQIRPLLDEMMVAANGHDANRFMSAYQNSKSLVVTFDDATIQGWRALLDQQRRWWEDGKSTAAYSEASPPRFEVISETVIATLQSINVGAAGADSASKGAKLTVTSIWKKLPEGWRIVVAHESMTH